MKGKARDLMHLNNAIMCAKVASDLYDLSKADVYLDSGITTLIPNLCYFAAEICEYENEEIAVYMAEGRSYTAKELLTIAANQLDPSKADKSELTFPTALRLAIRILETK